MPAKKKGKKLPPWVWVAAAAGVVLLFLVFRQNSGSSQQQGSSQGSALFVVPGTGTWATKKTKKNKSKP